MKNPGENCRVLGAVLKKVMSIVAKIKHSSLKSDAFLAELGKPLLSSNETRWNTSFKMARRASEFNWMSLSSVEFPEKLTSSQVDILKEFVKLMTPFEEVFLEMQAASRPTISSALPSYYKLQKSLKVLIKHLSLSYLLYLREVGI